MVITEGIGGSEAITYSVTGVTKGTRLDVDTTNTVTVKVEWDDSLSTMPEVTNKTLTVTLNYVQQD